VKEADGNLQTVSIGDKSLLLYRDKKTIWGQERTVIVYISEQLRAGQLRGIYQSLDKKKAKLDELAGSLENPRSKKREYDKLVAKIELILKGQFMEGLINYDLIQLGNGRYRLAYTVNEKNLHDLEEKLGFRILMTNHHQWSSEEIVQAFHGQATVEKAFKNIKNPFHLAIKPGFHWTDQKIKVHYFSCVLGYLLATLVWRMARKNAGFTGNLDTLLNIMGNIRLSTMVEVSGKSGKAKVYRKIEKLDPEQSELIEALDLEELHKKPLAIDGVGVYK